MPIRRRAVWVALAVLSMLGFGQMRYLRQPGRHDLAPGRFSEARLRADQTWESCKEFGDSRRFLPAIQCGVDQSPGETVEKKEASLERGEGNRVSDRSLIGALRSKNPAKVDAAVRYLEELASEPRVDPQILNDLAVAYSVRANLLDRPQDLALALGRSLDSLSSNPNQIAALYNVALFSTRLHLERTARSAWRSYLAVDSDSEWANEAREHLALLSRPTEVELFAELKRRAEFASAEDLSRTAALAPQLGREWVVEELLPEWGKAWRAGQLERAARTLEVASVVAQAIGRDGDQSALLAVKFIEKALGSESAQRIEMLALGHSELGEGRRLDKLDQVQLALPHFEQADFNLRALGSPMEAWASLLLTSARLGEVPYERTDEELTRLLRRPKLEKMPALKGFAFWLQGLLQIRRGRHAAAILHYQRAHEAFEASREVENMGGVSELVSEAFRYLGQRRAQWEYAYLALRLLRETPTSRRLHNVLWSTAEAAAQDNEKMLALQLHQEDVAVAEARADPGMLLDAILRQAVSEGNLNEVPKAWRDLHAGEHLLGEIEDSNFRSLMQKRFEFTLAKVQSNRDPAASIEGLSKAIDFYSKRSKPLEVLEALRARAAGNIALGRGYEAEEDVDRALRLIEDQAGHISPAGMGLSFVDASAEVFDLKFDLAARRGASGGELLEISEKSKGLVNRQLAIKAGESQEKLADSGEIVLVYHVTGNAVYVLLKLEHDRRVVLSTVPFGEVSNSLRSLEVALRNSNDRRAKLALTILYSQLIPDSLKAALRSSAGFRPLLVVPDRMLNLVPFSSLWDEESGRYLIEMTPLVVAPSLELYYYATSLVETKPRGRSALLIAEATSWDHSLLPDLKALPEVELEVSEIASLYPHATRLSSSQLNSDTFLEKAAANQVVHFSGHSIFNLEEQDSFLVISAEPGKGLLFAREIPKSKLKDTKLLTLAACSTVLSNSSRTGGLQSLGGSFIRAGVPSVVGSLWEIQDDEAREFFVRFHERYSSGSSVAEAVREAQVSMLRSGDSKLSRLTAWAAYQAVGAAENDH